VRTIVLTRAQLRAHAEREAKSMLGVSAKRAFRMLDTGELRGTIAACEMSMLRYMLESGQKSVARRRRKR
jgi:hypothetical protein